MGLCLHFDLHACIAFEHPALYKCHYPHHFCKLFLFFMILLYAYAAPYFVILSFSAYFSHAVGI